MAYQKVTSGFRFFSITVFTVLLPVMLIAQAPTLIFPKNNFVTSNTALTLEWNSIIGATGYKIQIDNDQLFTSPVKDVTDTITNFNTTLSSCGKYYWRVSADVGSGFNNWSTVWSFTIFSPDDLNTTTWYKADFGVHTDVTGVDSITDASGNFNTALQFYDANYRPAYIPASAKINGYPLIRFDGTNDFLDFRTTLTQIRTVFWVVREDSFASLKYRSLLGDTVPIQPYFHRGCCNGGFPGTDKYIYDESSALNPALYYADPSVVNGVTRLNHTVIDPTITNMPNIMSIINTRTSGPARAGNFSYDWRAPNEFRVWWGELAELIIYNDPLDTNNIKLVEEYLHDKYAPPINLGPDVIQTYRLCDTIDIHLNYFKTYKWYKNGSLLASQTGIDSIRITEPGIYSVEDTDIFNRPSWDTIIVQFVRPNVIHDTTICNGSSIVWNTGLGNGYNFLWQNGNTGSSFTINSSGDYWVEVIDNTGCVYRTDTVHVEVDSFNVVATLGPDTTLCKNQRIGLVSGAEQATSYSWSTGATTPEIVIVADGTYSLTATNVKGCAAIDDIVVMLGQDAPTVNFSAPNVCSGKTTLFNNLTPNTPPVTGWLWDFGDLNTDTQMNPSHTYSSPGSYTVKLVATADNGCTNDNSKTVTVFNLPQAYFTDTVFCAGIQRQFNDKSTPGDAPITHWFWDFGDSSTSNLKNPVHKYDTIGTFITKFRVTDSNVCVDSISRIVESVPGVPVADTPTLILPKDDVALSDSAVLFQWNPSAGAEYYTLQIATDPGFNNLVQTIDLFEDSVIVNNLSFSTGYYYWHVLAINLCGTVTPSAIYRFRLFTPGIISGNCLWLSADYGTDPLDINGKVSQWADKSPSANNAVQTTTLYKPQLITNVPELNGGSVLRFDGADDYVKFSSRIDAIRTVFWVIKEDPNATALFRHLLGDTDFEPDFHRGGIPGQLYDTTTNKRIWGLSTEPSVSNGLLRINGLPKLGTSTNAPTKYSIISTRTANNSNARANAFVIDRPALLPNEHRVWWGDLAELIIYCQPLSDSLIEAVESYLHNKYAPPVNLGPDIVRGYGLCDPVKIKAQDHFVKYLWDVPGMSNIPDTANSVDFYGAGTVSVTAVDIFGYITTDDVVVTGGLQNPFKDTVYLCLGDDTIWDTGLNNDYSFLWDDQTTDSFHVINLQKTYSVTVTDASNCTVSDEIYARVDSYSVLATLGSSDTSLCEGNRIKLITKAEETVEYHWSTGSTLPVISVTDSGIYSLTATNIHKCIVHDSMDVAIYGVAPIPEFTFDKICFNDPTLFTDATHPTDIVSWSWYFGDGGVDSIQHPVHLYQDTGRYNVRLLVKDSEACLQDTVEQVIIYELPATQFTNDPINCANDFVNFKDLSFAGGQTISQRSWAFGDGGTSTAQNPQNKYLTAGIYAISLEVTTDKGCYGAVYDTIEIFPELIADFRVENLCIDNTLTRFCDASPGFSNVAWVWDFGDNSAPSYLQCPSHSYITDGKYPVSLQVTNAIGCMKSVEDTISIADPPVANFDNPDLCEQLLFRFTDKTITNNNDNVVTWSWEFGDGSFSTVQNPFHTYLKDSVYHAKLSVVTGNGCNNSVVKTVDVISPPVADFDYQPKYGASPLNITFTNQSDNAVSYYWDFGDNSSISYDANPVHTFLQDGKYTITLIASSLPGCSDTISRTIDVVPPLFDLGIDQIFLTQSSNSNGCLLDMRAVIINYGTVDISSFDIQAHNSEGGRIEDHWEGRYPDNRQLNYQFSVQFVINDCDNVVICMDVMNPDGQQDQNPLNDHLCTTLSDEFVIIGPYPNPAVDFVRVDLMLPSKGALRVTNYNAIGQRLDLIENLQAAKGYYPLVFDTRLLPSGMYLLKIEFHDEEHVLKYEVR